MLVYIRRLTNNDRKGVLSPDVGESEHTHSNASPKYYIIESFRIHNPTMSKLTLKLNPMVDASSKFEVNSLLAEQLLRQSE